MATQASPPHATLPPLSRVGILPCRFASPFVPVGAGEGLCGVGTLASPSSCSRERLFPLARATQASPLHPTPLPPLRIRFILSPKYLPLKVGAGDACVALVLDL